MTQAVIIDGWLLVYGGWFDAETTSIEDHNLAAAIFAAEVEMREAEWEAVGVVLDHVDGRVLQWPTEAKDRADLFDALWKLGWLGVPSSPGEGASGEGS
ncbi:MAG TPA: hypothetical protein VJU14_10890 [Solirubrobacterales bacterium]|nr:hypothetical protein [Solirubrobacterales bacterium]